MLPLNFKSPADYDKVQVCLVVLILYHAVLELTLCTLPQPTDIVDLEGITTIAPESEVTMVLHHKEYVCVALTAILADLMLTKRCASAADLPREFL